MHNLRNLQTLISRTLLDCTFPGRIRENWKRNKFQIMLLLCFNIQASWFNIFSYIQTLYIDSFFIFAEQDLHCPSEPSPGNGWIFDFIHRSHICSVNILLLQVRRFHRCNVFACLQNVLHSTCKLNCPAYCKDKVF